MRPRSSTLTEQELEIMKIIWQRGHVTVRDVYEALLHRRKVAYTTVLTMMKILEQKGHLRRANAGEKEKAHVYTPAHTKDQVIRSMVREFVDRVFNGATEPLLLHLVETQNLSERDKQEIERMLRKRKALE